MSDSALRPSEARPARIGSRAPSVTIRSVQRARRWRTDLRRSQCSLEFRAESFPSFPLRGRPRALCAVPAQLRTTAKPNVGVVAVARLPCGAVFRRALFGDKILGCKTRALALFLAVTVLARAHGAVVKTLLELPTEGGCRERLRGARLEACCDQNGDVLAGKYRVERVLESGRATWRSAHLDSPARRVNS